MESSFLLGAVCGVVVWCLPVITLWFQLTWWRERAFLHGAAAAEENDRANYWQAVAEGRVIEDDDSEEEDGEPDYRGG